jgi:predicted SAM-dependent methyltransferase
MKPLVRIDLEKILQAGKPVVIDLGCGARKAAGRIGIDRVDLPTVDIVADLEQGLSFLPDRCVDELHCRSVLEHIDNFEPLFGHIVRVLKETGTAHIVVPHFSNPYYYSDYTHRRHFGLYSFYYFVDTRHQLRRKVPDFYTDIRVEIVSVKLRFRSPFRVIHWVRRFLGSIINLHPRLQEFYEGNLCYLMPCHCIEIVLKPASSGRQS